MLYLLLGGEFVAAGQVLVYAGAVMVMFLFVIAYLGDRTLEAPWAGGPSWQAIGAALAGGAILVEVIVAIGLKAGDALGDAGARSAARSARPRAIGTLFLTDHLLAFEVTSIVLLVAAVGGVVLGSHARAAERHRAAKARRAMDGPDVAWYLVLAGVLFVDRRARRADPPQPADHPALGRDHAQRREPRPDRVRAPARHTRTGRSSRSR